MLGFDRALRTLSGDATKCSRPNPAGEQPEADLSDAERILAGQLMRVNHVGEVCAQALYQGQTLTARNPDVQQKLQRSADEELDHLAWCGQRIDELGSRKSILNPLWYASSFALGVIAGAAGDKWSLGFVQETEQQVEKHLHGHLEELPEHDARSRTILAQMREDEARHAETAKQAGASELPTPVKKMMEAVSKIMTQTARWL